MTMEEILHVLPIVKDLVVIQELGTVLNSKLIMMLLISLSVMKIWELSMVGQK